MANGLLGKTIPTPGNFTEIYMVPSTGVSFATVTISGVNKASVTALVSLAIGTNATPTDGDTLDFDSEVPIKGRYVEDCILMSPGERLFVSTTSLLMPFRCTGLEKSSI